MAERRVDREAWAEVVSELLIEYGGNKSALARAVGVKAGVTIDRWIKMSVDVTEANVKEVARNTGRNPAELLVRVGYYQPHEITGGMPTAPIDPERAIQIIEASDAPAPLKRRLIEHVREMRERDEAAAEVRRAEEIERILALTRKDER